MTLRDAVVLAVGHDNPDNVPTLPKSVETPQQELSRRRIRIDVERVLEAYALSDPFKYRCIIAILAQRAGFVTSFGTRTFYPGDGNFVDWKCTIGAKLARMRRACGMCNRKRVGCDHVDALLAVARATAIVRNERAKASEYHKRLSSPTKRRRMGRSATRDAMERKESAIRTVELYKAERERITRTDTYSDAIEIAWLAFSENEMTRRYCFRDFEVEQVAA